MSKATEAPASIWDIPRNDIEACHEYWTSKDGKLDNQEWRTMLKLQDDPADLLAAIKTWTVDD